MSKISFFLMALLFLSGCNTKAEEASETPGEVAASGEFSLPATVQVDAGAREVLDGWAEYRSLEDRMAILAETRDEEEMKLLLEELNQICQRLGESTFPEAFDQPSVRSRLKVIQTYLGKLDAALFYRLDYQEPLVELMASYNALREQFNVIVRTTLRPELFEDE